MMRLKRQQGFVLIVALIVLVVMTLGAVALVRSTDITTLVSGNLAFRKVGMHSADSGVEAARKWLMTTPDLTAAIQPMYFPTADGGVTGLANTSTKIFNPTTFDWANNSVSLPPDSNGNTVSYVIHRMCQAAGDPSDPNTNCMTVPISAEGSSNRIVTQGEFSCVGNNCNTVKIPLYRITARVMGPKGAVSYMQTVIY